MGFTGTFLVSTFVAWASTFFSFAPRMALWRERLLVAVVAGLFATLIKLIGNACGIFLDGELAEWLVTSLTVIVVALLSSALVAS